jgi:hypothetical protein
MPDEKPRDRLDSHEPRFSIVQWWNHAPPATLIDCWCADGNVAPGLTASAVTKRIVQRARHAGGGPQTIATPARFLRAVERWRRRWPCIIAQRVLPPRRKVPLDNPRRLSSILADRLRSGRHREASIEEQQQDPNPPPMPARSSARRALYVF